MVFPWSSCPDVVVLCLPWFNQLKSYLISAGWLQLFLLRAAGFLLPCYIMAWAISILQRRRQRQVQWQDLCILLLLLFLLSKVTNLCSLLHRLLSCILLEDHVRSLIVLMDFVYCLEWSRHCSSTVIHWCNFEFDTYVACRWVVVAGLETA